MTVSTLQSFATGPWPSVIVTYHMVQLRRAFITYQECDGKSIWCRLYSIGLHLTDLGTVMVVYTQRMDGERRQVRLPRSTIPRSYLPRVNDRIMLHLSTKFGVTKPPDYRRSVTQDPVNTITPNPNPPGKDVSFCI